MTHEQETPRPNGPKDVPRAGFTCGSYLPGHCVHYIPVQKLVPDLIPVSASLQCQGDQLTLLIQNESSPVWTHNTDGVQEIIEDFGSECDWFPTLKFARWVHENVRHWVNLSLEPVSVCASVERVRRAEMRAWS